MEKIKKPKMPDIETVTNSSVVSRWIPLICAGAAAGISIVALQEIKNVRKEIITLKKENSTNSLSDELNKKIENMEAQLKTLADFIQNKDKITKESEVIRNVVKQSEEPSVRIINDEEYEEVEVTDDEAE
jgi:hypothetical protein